MKRSYRVTVKLKCRKQKQSLMYKYKNLGTKARNLRIWSFWIWVWWISGRLFVSKSMSHENQQLAYNCWQLKSTMKIHSTWFFNNIVNVKRMEHGRIHKIFHITDTQNLLETNNLEGYVNNASFYFN